MPEKVQILTPENVRLEYEVADIGSRSMALIYDTLIQALLVLVVLVPLLLASLNKSVGLLDRAADKVVHSTWTMVFAVIFLFLVYQGYFLLFEAFWGGRTPGKQSLGLRVVMEDGRALTFRAALIRNLLRAADFLPGLYATGVVVAFCNSGARRIGDWAAGTQVVKVGKQAKTASSSGDHVGDQTAEPPASRLSPQARQTAGDLSSEDVLVLRRLAARFQELSPDVAQNLAADVLGRLSGRVQFSDADLQLSKLTLVEEIVRCWDSRRAV